MTPGDAQAVYAAGWSDAALLHAVAVCAYFNNMNRLVEGAALSELLPVTSRPPKGSSRRAMRNRRSSRLRINLKTR